MNCELESIICDYSQGCFICKECGFVQKDSVTDYSYNQNIEQPDIDKRKSLFYTVFENLFSQFSLIFSIAIENDAKMLYEEYCLKAVRQCLLHGKNMEYMVYAFIYVSAENNNFPVTLEFITDPKIVKKLLKKCINEVKSTIGCKKEISREYGDRQLESFIVKYCNMLQYTKRMTRDIIKLIPKTEFILRKKDIVACGLIVFYKNNKSLIKPVSQVTCVSELAIKRVFNELCSK